jgi:hypothetical protein
MENSIKKDQILEELKHKYLTDKSNKIKYIQWVFAYKTEAELEERGKWYELYCKQVHALGKLIQHAQINL